MFHSKTSPPSNRGLLVVLIVIAPVIALGCAGAAWWHKHQAVSLERCRVLERKLGDVVTEWRWVEEAESIARKGHGLADRFVEVREIVQEGQSDSAWFAMGELMADFWELAHQNMFAEQAAVSRTRLLRARASLSQRLEAQAADDPEFTRIFQDPDQAWRACDWKTARRLYDLGYAKGYHWLERKNATPDEIDSWRKEEGASTLAAALRVERSRNRDLQARLDNLYGKYFRDLGDERQKNQELVMKAAGLQSTLASKDTVLRDALADAAAKGKSLSVAIDEVRDITRAWKGALSNVADLQLRLSSAAQNLDYERNARTTAQNERDRARQRVDSKEKALESALADAEVKRRALERSLADIADFQIRLSSAVCTLNDERKIRTVAEEERDQARQQLDSKQKALESALADSAIKSQDLEHALAEIAKLRDTSHRSNGATSFGGIRNNYGIGARTPINPSVRPPFSSVRPSAVTPAETPPQTGSDQRLSPMATQLVDQIEEFIWAFRPTAAKVPEGGQFLSDASALRGAATRFRTTVTTGAAPAELARDYRAIAAHGQRLQNRTARIARGTTGPNIQRIQQLCDTIVQIQEALGVTR